MGSAKRSLSERLEKHLLRAIVKTFRPWARMKTFGPVEALAYGSEVDHWMRYAPVDAAHEQPALSLDRHAAGSSPAVS